MTAGAIVAIFGINAWRKEIQYKRNSELAEKSLFLIYEARTAIKAIRNSFSSGIEYASRKINDDEDPKAKRALDMSYVVFSRIDKQSELFNEIRTTRQRCRVLFGEAELECFDDVFDIIREIQIATRKLARRYWPKNPEILSPEKKEAFYDEMYALEDIIWETTDDEISKKCNALSKKQKNHFENLFLHQPHIKNLEGCMKNSTSRFSQIFLANLKKSPKTGRGPGEIGKTKSKRVLD
ncbi:hypothetical protein [Desulfovibrio sp. JC022]|uniref:hypothetical protein n=1 Tax=Desulfovibrio sp. JC022 TaxID=2593642 RepID=UPI0013D24E15|nr:hypothetical protein [Desulfovibrio sp. JC022]NDV24542.1 hypothetical protein [Desulfovibrio sp. JC022]